MKKFLLLLLISNACFAQNVTIVWPFGAGDADANYSRTLVEAANQIQTKYKFIFEPKPGAGSSIAANYVLSQPNTIMSATAAFFVRPNFYPAESHDISQFKPLMTQCSAPFVVASSKYKNIKELPRNQRITIGVSGTGTTTNLLALQLKKQYDQIEPVPYKTTLDIMNDVLGNRVDMLVGFVSGIDQYVNTKKLYVIGITGGTSYPGYQIFGTPETREIINNFSLLVPKNISQELYKEWQEILKQASWNPIVIKAYSADKCEPRNNTSNLEDWFTGQVKLWKKVSDQ